jgi:prophage regulatory protein
MMTNAVELISFDETERVTLLSRSTIFRQIKSGEFPQPVPLGDKKRAFVKAEVEAYIRERVASRKGAA